LGAVLLVAGGGVACGRTPLAYQVDTPPINLALVAACTKWMSCRGAPKTGEFRAVVRNVSDCVWQNQPNGIRSSDVIATDGLFTTTSVACLDAASDCSAVHACETGGTSLDCSGVLVSGGTCEGQRLVKCVLDHAQSQDCSLAGFFEDPGGSCYVGLDGTGRCGFGACSPQGPQPSQCEDRVMSSCTDGVLDRFTCPVGSTCGIGSSGSPTCIGDGPPCTTDRCDGDTAVECVGGHEFRFACDQTGILSSCGTDPSAGQIVCVPSGKLRCDPKTFDDFCDGTSIHYCDGEIRTIDCVALGFRVCSAGLCQ
jgi:hypothetical protein